MELPKHLGEFLSRDIAYALSGVSVELSLLYKFGLLQYLDLSLAVGVFLAAAGWAIGIALQISFSAIGIVTTVWIRNPNNINKWLYQRITGENWKATECRKEEADRALREMLEDEYRRAHYERLVTHVIAGACLAPSALLSSGLFIWKSLQSHEVFDITVASGLFLLGIVLVIANRIKAMDMTQKDWSICIASKLKAKHNV